MSRNTTILMASAIALMSGEFGPGPVYQIDTRGPTLRMWPAGIPYRGGKTRSRTKSWGTLRRKAAKMRRRMA